MKFLITGGAGFVGTHMAIRLKNLGHTPILVDFENQYTNFHLKSFKTYGLDISNRKDLFSVKENINLSPCITECNIGRFPSTCGFLNQIGQFNVGEWFVRFALDDLPADAPSKLIDLEHSSIYMIRSLDQEMALLSEDEINAFSLNK